MNIQMLWDFSKIPVNQAFTSRLLVTVETPRKTGRPRRPLNVAVVLDRSGSMSGAKLQRVKEATRILVEKLGPEDIFSLTVFDTVVTPLVAPMPVRDGGHSIARTIEAIHAGSSTNLSGGYLQGCDFARRNNSPERINRVILLSDGLANEGITHPQELARLAQAHRRENLTTSTIGVGSDFNEELMGKMAEQGGGSTYFIDRPEEANSVFLEELGDLKAVAATGFQIRFAPSLPGVQAAQLNNYGQPAADVYYLGDILEGIPKHLVLEVKLPPARQEGRVEIGRLEFLFHEAVETGFQGRREEFPVELDVVALDEFASIIPVREVTLQAAYLTVAAVKAESIRLSDQGHFQEAAAVLENCANTLREMQLHDPRLDRMIQELFDSARQLRERGEQYYTPRQRKQMYFEAELTQKSQTAKADRMRQRQGRPED
ncbi:MAG: VWA domain-containing protein [bacterium]